MFFCEDFFFVVFYFFVEYGLDFEIVFGDFFCQVGCYLDEDDVGYLDVVVGDDVGLEFGVGSGYLCWNVEVVFYLENDEFLGYVEFVKVVNGEGWDGLWVGVLI